MKDFRKGFFYIGGIVLYIRGIVRYIGEVLSCQQVSFQAVHGSPYLSRS